MSELFINFKFLLERKKKFFKIKWFMFNNCFLEIIFIEEYIFIWK